MRKPDIDLGAAGALVRRVFGTAVPLSLERTAEGVSTQVYRVRRGPETFYLRIAEEAGENLETDAELHRRLRGLGVRTADIVHVEPFNRDIGRSTMITTEVPGVPVAAIASPAVAARVVEEAGADLALVNRVPVEGFGFVRRDGGPLRAEYPDHADFVASHLPRPWPGPLGDLFTAPTLAAIEDAIDQQRARPPAGAVLAHGDFDTTPIFCAGGRYTGLIDFGEIRGAEPLFDLGHFVLYHGGTALVPALLRGYQRVGPLPGDHDAAIRRSAVLLGLRQLCRWLGPPRSRPLDHPAVTRRARRLQELVGYA